MTCRTAILTISLTALFLNALSQTTGQVKNTLDSVLRQNDPLKLLHDSTLKKKLPVPSMSSLAAELAAQKNKALSTLDLRQRLTPLQDVFKNPIAFHNGQAAYSRGDISSYASPGDHAALDNVVLSSSWSVASIPFDIQFNNQTWTDISRNNFSNLSLQFNRENYLNQLKKKLKGNADAGELLSNLKNPADALRQQASALLQKDLDAINKNYNGILESKIKEMGDLKGMLNKNMVELRQQVINNEYVKAIQEKEQLLTTLQYQKNSGQITDAQQLAALEQEINSMKGATALVAAVEAHKKKWESSGLLNRIKQLDLLQKDQVEKLMNDPATTIRQAKQQLNLSGLQRFFLKMSNLNIGQNTLSESPLSVQHLLNKGINTEFFNNNRFLLLGMGKTQSLNGILDMPFTDNLSALDGISRTLRMGLGNTGAAHTHLSLMSYSQSFGSFDGFSPVNNFRNSLITTISNQLPIGARGVLKTEVSRSATTYQYLNNTDSSLPDKSAAQRIFSGDDLFKNMAFAISYDDELEDKGIAYGVHVNKTANGYTNPGSVFLNAGGQELGFNFRKSFWKRKLQASIRSEVREFKYSEDYDRRYRNFYTVMDLRLRLKKGQSLTVRYIPNRMTRIEDGKKSRTNLVDRLSVEGNFAKKIAGNYYRNTLSLSWQKNIYALGIEMLSNTALLLSSFQNYTIGNKLLYLNSNYNFANNPSEYVYFNSSFLGEAGITYLLFKKISSSSAVTYNSVSGWYRQMGIRQTISNQLNNRFNLNLYIDARKNLALYQPLLYGLFRADISIQYSISK